MRALAAEGDASRRGRKPSPRCKPHWQPLPSSLNRAKAQGAPGFSPQASVPNSLPRLQFTAHPGTHAETVLLSSVSAQLGYALLCHSDSSLRPAHCVSMAQRAGQHLHTTRQRSALALTYLIVLSSQGLLALSGEPLAGLFTSSLADTLPLAGLFTAGLAFIACLRPAGSRLEPSALVLCQRLFSSRTA